MKRLLVYFLVLALFSGVSCKKIKENQLQRTWKSQAFTDESKLDYVEIWDFQKNNVLVVQKQSVRDPQLKYFVAQGPYELKGNPFTRYTLKIDSISGPYEGEWKVLTLKKNSLIILLEREQVWKYMSFVAY